MSLLSWADNRTLLGCQVILCAMFVGVLWMVRRMYPHLRGTGCYALGFLCVLLGNALLMMRGVAPYFISVVIANLLQFSLGALLYTGTLRFFRSDRSPAPVWIIVAISTAILCWYTVLHDQIVTRIAVIAVTVLAQRLLLAAELSRRSSGRPFLKLFAVFALITGLVSVARGGLTMLHGAPANYMQRDTIQTGALVLNMVFVFLYGFFVMVLVLQELIGRIEILSQLDSVSGLLNRRGIEQCLANELNRIERNHQRLSVAFIDIDHFKRINDSVGHAAGDTALRNVADAVSGQLRGYDSLGRFGGDEFLLVLPQTAGEDAALVADRFASAVRTASPDLDITLSIGITEALAGESAADLLLRADQALYAAKDAGRNCIRTVFTGSASPLAGIASIAGSTDSRTHLAVS